MHPHSLIGLPARHMTNPIEVQFEEIIAEATDQFGDHEGIRTATVARWLSQFREQDRALAEKILRATARHYYYSASQIRKMSSELAQSVYSTHRKTPKNRIYFIPIGDPGSGAHYISRSLRSADIVPRRNLISLAELEKLDRRNVDVIVFFDDFSGTGHTILDWWPKIEPLVLPKEARVLLALLVVNEKARNQLEAAHFRVIAVEELDSSANVFGPENHHFSANDKTALLAVCKQTGCSEEYLRGYGECGLLVAFKHNCPNNSIPVLWYENPGKWRPLFVRRAL